MPNNPINPPLGPPNYVGPGPSQARASIQTPALTAAGTALAGQAASNPSGGPYLPYIAPGTLDCNQGSTVYLNLVASVTLVLPAPINMEDGQKLMFVVIALAAPVVTWPSNFKGTITAPTASKVNLYEFQYVAATGNWYLVAQQVGM